jgi:hypothetical protein
MWIRDIRKRSGLQTAVVTKVIKELMRRKLIKCVKSIAVRALPLTARGLRAQRSLPPPLAALRARTKRSTCSTISTRPSRSRDASGEFARACGQVESGGRAGTRVASTTRTCGTFSPSRASSSSRRRCACTLPLRVRHLFSRESVLVWASQRAASPEALTAKINEAGPSRQARMRARLFRRRRG